MAKKTQTKKAEATQKISDADVKKLLAEEADKKREAGKAQAPKQAEKRISFDVWYAVASKKIPAQHRKEVIKADFVARGVEGLKTKEEYDKALEAYGVKL